MRTKMLILAMMVILFASCETKEHRNKRISECKYLFIDSQGVTHIDEKCEILKSDKQNIKERVLKTEMYKYALWNTCNKCITDEDFEQYKKYFSR